MEIKNSINILVSNIAKKISEILYSGFTLLYEVSRLKMIGKKDVSSNTNNAMKRVFFLQIWYIFKGFLKTGRNLVIIPVFSPILHWGLGTGKQKIVD